MAKRKKMDGRDQERLQSSIRMNIRQQDERMYQAREKSRILIGKEAGLLIGLTVLFGVLFLISLLVLVNVSLRAPTLAWVIENTKNRTDALMDLATGNHSGMGMQFILTQFLSIILSGAALAASGAIYQGTFHNPMASPTFLGVQSGGTLGKTIYSIYILTPGTMTVMDYEHRKVLIDGQTILQRYTGQFFVLAGCFLAVFLVVTVSRIAGHGKINTVAMILTGSVLSSLIGTLVNVLKYTSSSYQNSSVAEAAASTQMQTTFGSISSPLLLALMAVPILVSLLIAMLLRNRINLIVFGEAEAKTIGIHVERQRIVLIIISTVLTATVISFCGQVAFIGLIAAVLARRLVGPDYRYLLPASVLMGSILLLLAYDACYMIGFDVDTGSMAGILGGLVFMGIMTANRRKKNADWA